ncbi:MAG: phosphatidate cytidylyltransferase [Bacteroidetes bacterium]|nr:phosphatidate cytidylyltransferase [Bacteroidota bacterium]
MKEILIRTLSGIVFLIVVIGSILLHPIAFLIVFGVFTVIGLYEYYALTGISGKANKIIFVFIGLLLYALLALIGIGKVDITYALLIFLVFPVVITFQLFEKEVNWSQIGSVFSGYFYVAAPFGLLNTFFSFSYHESFPGFLLVSMLVIVWCNDIFAYLTGSFFGKHKLFERISPKKTWEGFFGGLLFALLSAYVLSLFSNSLSVTEWLVLAKVIVVTATIGDLSESMLKRNAGVKDSGSLMPGHGGVLDRFDAVLFATPFVFIYLKFLL